MSIDSINLAESGISFGGTAISKREVVCTESEVFEIRTSASILNGAVRIFITVVGSVIPSDRDNKDTSNSSDAHTSFEV